MVKRVTKRKEGKHYVISVGGHGMCLAFSKKEANNKIKSFRKQLKRK